MCGRHVGTFCYCLDPVFDQGVCVVTVQFVLCSAGECYINGNIPDGAIGSKACVLPSFGVVRDTSTFDSFDLVEQIDINALFIDHVTGRIRGGDDGGAQLLCVVDRVDSNIARTGDRHGGTVE